MNDPGGWLDYSHLFDTRETHTIFASEAIHEGALLQFHGTVNGVAVLVKLEAVLRRIDEVALVVGPLVEELTRSESSKAVIVLYKVVERKLLG